MYFLQIRNVWNSINPGEWQIVECLTLHDYNRHYVIGFVSDHGRFFEIQP